MPAGKELRFLDESRDRGVDWYLEQFAPDGERLAGEATATYVADTRGHRGARRGSTLTSAIVAGRQATRSTGPASHYTYGVARSWYSEPYAAMITRRAGGLLDGTEQPLRADAHGRAATGTSWSGPPRHVPGDRILVAPRARRWKHRADRRGLLDAALPASSACDRRRFGRTSSSSSARQRGRDRAIIARCRALFHANACGRGRATAPDLEPPALDSCAGLERPGYAALDRALRTPWPRIFEADSAAPERFPAIRASAATAVRWRVTPLGFAHERRGCRDPFARRSGRRASTGSRSPPRSPSGGSTST